MNPLRHAPATAALIGASLCLLAGCGRQVANETASKPNEPTNANARPRPAQASADARMVSISAGRFLMGDSHEVDAPPHSVALSSFYIDKCLVTQQQYEELMHENPSRWKGATNPVEQVRWSDAVRFCNRRSESEGRRACYDLKSWTCNFDADGYRLPTEAEWEYACRAGADTAYFFGDNPAKLGDYAWFDKNSGGHARPVAQKQPNPWGLYDICGNLWEWCNDFYKVDYYQESPRQDPRGPTQGQTKVVRGGAWRFSADNCRCGYRYNESPGYADVCFGYDIYGFRCVRKASGN